MNYRRGLKRAYAVLAIAWIATLLYVLPSGRLKFWSAQPSAQPNVAPVYNPTASGVANVIEIPASSRDERQYKFKMTDGKIYVVTTEDTIAERPIGKFAWLAAWLFAPPIFAYGLLFIVLPWVFRGFKPAPQI
jgi:hypothetical protein